MRRIFWFGVGVAVTVVVVRRGRAWVEATVPPGAVTTAEKVAGAAGTWRRFRADFEEGRAASQAQLLHDLVGDADLEQIRASAPERRERLRGARRQDFSRWADQPTQDPDDDDGYAF